MSGSEYLCHRIAPVCAFRATTSARKVAPGPDAPFADTPVMTVCPTRIGERRGTGWSLQEQSGAQSAAETTQAELAAVNAAYEARFGYIFIVCATGKSGDEMLAIARRRLGNDHSAFG